MLSLTVYFNSKTTEPTWNPKTSSLVKYTCHSNAVFQNTSASASDMHTHVRASTMIVGRKRVEAWDIRSVWQCKHGKTHKLIKYARFPVKPP